MVLNTELGKTKRKLNTDVLEIIGMTQGVLKVKAKGHRNADQRYQRHLIKEVILYLCPFLHVYLHEQSLLINIR